MIKTTTRTGANRRYAAPSDPADQTLTGTDYNDLLIGDTGNDTLFGGRGVDTLYGDGVPAHASGVGSGSGRFTKSAGLGNFGFQSAVNLNPLFARTANANIVDSTITPHVTVSATGDGNIDYYAIRVAFNSTVTLDIDATYGFDSFVTVYDAGSNIVAFNDNSATSDGAGGSVDPHDSFLTFTAASASTTYYIAVSSSRSDGTTGAVTAVPSGAAYQLQVSVADAPAFGSGSGNDVLDGGTGADLMYGGAGDDSYFVDDAGDRVFERTGEGFDRVQASVSYTLAAGQEVELLWTQNDAGTTAIALTGNTIAQTLRGNAGANILDGGGGADSLYGLGGNDNYYVDSPDDLVYEAVGGGKDAIASTVSYALLYGQEIESLYLRTPANSYAADLTGNGFNQFLQGNNGANTLDGKGGADVMSGLGGDDTYIVDNPFDTVIEQAGQGNDRIRTSISYTLADSVSVEILTTTFAGDTTAINLTGNASANAITGNNGANILDGKGGADTLFGREGADIFAFTTALGGGNVDIIFDFANATNSVHDTIRLSRAVFGQIGAGATLAASAFKDVTSGAAIDGDDRILYDRTTGALFYDADGSGSTAAVQFASIDNKVTLSAADFAIAG